MILTLSHPSNYDFIVRNADEDILYWVERQTHGGVRVYKPTPSMMKTLFAEIEFRHWGTTASFIELDGKKRRLEEVFRPKHWPSE